VLLAWAGVGTPKNTPAEIIGKLNKEINAALADPVLKARFADLGGTVLAGSPADFGKLIADETEKWGEVASRSTERRRLKYFMFRSASRGHLPAPHRVF
jgi:tripartite-type tricarboxylate transporter receptor subunit TctC